MMNAITKHNLGRPRLRDPSIMRVVYFRGATIEPSQNGFQVRKIEHQRLLVEALVKISFSVCVVGNF